MPHYFFDLTDDKIIHDFKGKQLRDLKQAPGTRTGHRSRCDDHGGIAFTRANFRLVGHREGWKIP